MVKGLHPGSVKTKQGNLFLRKPVLKLASSYVLSADRPVRQSTQLHWYQMRAHSRCHALPSSSLAASFLLLYLYFSGIVVPNNALIKYETWVLLAVFSLEAGLKHPWYFKLYHSNPHLRSQPYLLIPLPQIEDIVHLRYVILLDIHIEGASSCYPVVSFCFCLVLSRAVLPSVYLKAR